MKRYLVLGGSGLLGKQLASDLRVYSASFYSASRTPTSTLNDIECNVLSMMDLQRAFEIVQPTVVINATNLAGGVDYCEKNPEKAKEFHFEANKNIGKLCLSHGARMVLISTDYVFDGTKPPYSEIDTVCPLNAYGREKLAAEDWMQKNLSRFTIARTTNVFGWDPLTKTPNFLMALYFKLSKGEPANAPSFLWGNPTHVSQLSQTILELCEKEMNGIYNVVGSSYINRFEWAKLFCNKLNFDESLVIEQKDAPTNIAPRPFKSNLSIDKIKRDCITPILDVYQGLEIFKSEMQG